MLNVIFIRTIFYCNYYFSAFLGGLATWIHSRPYQIIRPLRVVKMVPSTISSSSNFTTASMLWRPTSESCICKRFSRCTLCKLQVSMLSGTGYKVAHAMRNRRTPFLWFTSKKTWQYVPWVGNYAMLTESPAISSVDCVSWWSQRTPIRLRPPIPMRHFGCSMAMDWTRKYITSRCVAFLNCGKLCVCG